MSDERGINTKLVCKHCGCRAGLWGGTKSDTGFWKHQAGGPRKGCGRKLTDADIRRVPVTRVKRKPGTPEYYSYRAMLTRCYSTKHLYFHNYGGRGITVCERWRISFKNFLADMGPRPAGHTLDRIDNDGNYEPSNCRWATRSEQERNKRPVCNKRCHLISFDGETMGLHQWGIRLGVRYQMISRRLRRGWSVEAALTTPSGNEGRRTSRLMKEGKPIGDAKG